MIYPKPRKITFIVSAEQAVQGMSAEEAVKWAEGELKKIYT